MDTITLDPSAATLVNVLTCDPNDQAKLLGLRRENIDNVIALLVYGSAFGRYLAVVAGGGELETEVRDFIDKVADRQGFEPWIPCGIHAFQACAFSHSAICPVLHKATL
jgi:hypothetical protein